MSMTAPRAWKFRVGSDERLITQILDSGSIGLDYGTPGVHQQMTRDELISAIRIHNPERSERGIRALAGQMDALLNKVKMADLALVPRQKGKLIMIGEILSDQPSIYKTSIEFQVRWITPDVPISHFDQDLQYSFMAIHKFCEVSRNEASKRLMRICEGEADPGFS
jgi:restriction system protein